VIRRAIRGGHAAGRWGRGESPGQPAAGQGGLACSAAGHDPANRWPNHQQAHLPVPGVVHLGVMLPPTLPSDCTAVAHCTLQTVRSSLCCCYRSATTRLKYSLPPAALQHGFLGRRRYLPTGRFEGRPRRRRRPASRRCTCRGGAEWMFLGPTADRHDSAHCVSRHIQMSPASFADLLNQVGAFPLL